MTTCSWRHGGDQVYGSGSGMGGGGASREGHGMPVMGDESRAPRPEVARIQTCQLPLSAVLSSTSPTLTTPAVRRCDMVCRHYAAASDASASMLPTWKLCNETEHGVRDGWDARDARAVG